MILEFYSFTWLFFFFNKTVMHILMIARFYFGLLSKTLLGLNMTFSLWPTKSLMISSSELLRREPSISRLMIEFIRAPVKSKSAQLG